MLNNEVSKLRSIEYVLLRYPRGSATVGLLQNVVSEVDSALRQDRQLVVPNHRVQLVLERIPDPAEGRVGPKWRVGAHTLPR